MENEPASTTTTSTKHNGRAKPTLGKTRHNDQANLGSIWAATIINMEMVEANAFRKIHESHNLGIQTTYKEFVLAVLQTCTYLADTKDKEFKTLKEGDWEVVKLADARSGLGLALGTYRLWTCLDLSDNTHTIRCRDGRRTSCPCAVSRDHRNFEFQEFIRKHMALYSEYTEPRNRKEGSTSTVPVVDLQTIYFLDYRMGLMNFANTLVDLVKGSKILPRCQDVDTEVVKRHPSVTLEGEFPLDIQGVEKVFNHALNQMIKRGVFPEPLVKEQGEVFDKPSCYVAWCIASMTTDMEDVDEMVARMVTFAEQYFQKIKTFVSMDGEVIDKKSRCLEAVRNATEMPDQSTFTMMKTFFTAFRMPTSLTFGNRS